MSQLRGENKIAVLLTSMPRLAAENVLARLGPERGQRLRDLMERVREEVTPELVDDVLGEFEDALYQATHSIPETRPRLAQDSEHDADTYEPGNPSTARAGLRLIGDDGTAPPVDNDIAELRLIESDRLAVALQGEHPRGVATVLSCLEPERAGETLMRLPPEVRKEVFPRLGPMTGRINDLALRIVRAVVAKSRVAAAPEQDSGDEKAQMMADMLRSMERNDRSDLMNALTERDEALAAAVRERLYVFDDLAVIEGQSMQKLLAAIDAKTLAVALQNASESILEKVMTNLSKRARESLKEEMNFLESTSAAQVQQARKSVVDVIQRMDLAGELG